MLKKPIFAMIISCILFYGMISPVAAVDLKDPEGVNAVEIQPLTVSLSSHIVKLDGETVTPETYCINGENYFKLRDVAKLLDGTAAQFNVSWIADSQTIEITTKQSYTIVGGELESVAIDRISSVVPSEASVVLNGAPVSVTGYFINGGTNYYRLRDLGAILGFGVAWDNDTRAVIIDSGTVAEEPAEEPETPVTRLDGKLTILVDAGHGGKDTGAGTTDKTIYERELNLEVAQYLQELLKQAGVTVYMMREDNETTMNADARRAVIEQYADKLDLCISVHHNAYKGTTEGSELLAQIQYKNGGAGQDLAKSIGDQFVAMGHTVRPTIYREGAQGDYYYMLRYPANVGVLAAISEFCYLDNQADAAWIQTTEQRYAEAQAIYNGIMKFFDTYEY